MLVPMIPPPTTFVERSDPGAHATLDALRKRLRAGGLDARLLVSKDGPSVHLLLVEGDPPLTAADREGARVWRFIDAASEAERGADADAAAAAEGGT